LDAIESFLWRVYTTPVVYLDLKNIASERQRDREINEGNETRRLDTILRTLVRTCVLSLPSVLQARYGKALNKVRKVTFVQLKPLVEQHTGDDESDLWILGVFKENLQRELPAIEICFD
uniref:SNF2_N domain-containing protein n=1 Tax=Schistocephalus solidus TaxID=70667 RepID=A0A183SAT7_SCHSO